MVLLHIARWKLGSKTSNFVLTKIVNLVTTLGEFMHIIVEPYDYTKPVRMQNGHQWDPGGDLRNYTAVMWSQFKQWDSGKICVVSNFYNLEDNVNFKGECIVMKPKEKDIIEASDVATKANDPLNMHGNHCVSISNNEKMVAPRRSVRSRKTNSMMRDYVKK
ncbi:unnamed protein product [Trifolium pratense]|uniref:Uncharacterized protein n=1 Tax=Trifolium pratense TaxID=57577 RepID=A0ACB0JMQ9_TRIPR|nr:unnamed protein product [Trifolium pratense]